MWEKINSFYFKIIATAKAGFTLMEITAVVLILGILAAIALPQYQRVLESSRVSEAITMLGNISTAEKMYLMQMGQFTPNFSELMLQIPITPRSGDDSYASGTYFDYDISNCTGYACDVMALRSKEGSYPYEIHLTGVSSANTPGQRTCHSTDNFGIKICLNICKEETMSSDNSCRMD